MLGPFAPCVDLADAEIAVVVTVRWLWRTWYLSDRQINGDVQILPGLAEVPEINDAISLSSVDSGTSISLAMVLPDITIQDWIDAGYDLDDLSAEVSVVLHRRGEMLHDWVTRDIIADGDADQAVHGDPTKPGGWLSFTVEDSPYRIEQPIVSRAWVVDDVTWPSSPQMGERYPLVVGEPDPEVTGDGPPAVVVEVNGVPENTLVLLSAGWARAQTVTLRDNSGNTETFNVTYQADGRGQMCAVADISGALTISIAAGTTYTSAWAFGPALEITGSGSNALSVAAFWLNLSGADIDTPEWERVGALLGCSVAGWVDDPETDGWEVARSVMQGLPVTTRRSRDGWAPVVLDPHLWRGMAHPVPWVEGSDSPYRRASAWQPTGDSRVTRVEVKSAYNTVQHGYDATYDAPLPHAWVRHLPRQSEASSSAPWAYLRGQDYRAAAWIARSRAMGWEASAWQVPAQYGLVRSGDIVYLGDDDTYAIVQRRSVSGGVWDYTLVRPRGK